MSTYPDAKKKAPPGKSGGEKPAQPVKSKAKAAAAPAGNSGGPVRPRLIPGSDQVDGEVAATPQEEAEVDQAVDKALVLIHGRKSRDATIQMLHDPSQEVSETVGRAAFRILSTISEQKQAATGEPLSETVLEEAAGYVIPELMKVGVAAGIFPFDDPDPDEPGSGDTEFDKQVRMAMLEATKLYGESELRKPGGPQRSQQAQDDWAAGIAEEVRNGTADPEFLAAARERFAIAGDGAAAATDAEAL